MLPTLVLVAALCAVAVASVMPDARASGEPLLIPFGQTAVPAAFAAGQRSDSALRRVFALAVPVAITLSLVATPFLFLPNPKATIPVDVITGRLSPTAYVAHKFPAATTLSAASSLLPPDTPIAFFGVQQEGAQIYTEARLMYFSADLVGMTPVGILSDFDLLGTTAEEVLASLERLGVEHFIWSRAESRPEDWRSTLLSTEFLRQHTRILAAADNTYLFEVVPHPGEWVVAPRNLLADPELEGVGRSGLWTGPDRARSRKGVVTLAPRDTIAQQVPISGASAYLLLSSGRCHDPDDAAELTLRWLDNQNVPLEIVTEKVIPGTKRSDQFLWSTAPNDAVAVLVELSTSYKGSRARCEFDEVALYSSS
jgi:hypothetical protein